MISKALRESRYDLVEGLHALGGWRDHEEPTKTRTFQARYNLDPDVPQAAAAGGIDIVAEIVNAIRHEVAAEMGQLVLKEGIAKSPEGESTTHVRQVMNVIDEITDEMPGECLVFGSPTALLFGSQKSRKRKQFLSSPLLGLQFHSRRRKSTLILNPYAFDEQPILVCASGWFTFRYKDVLWDKEGPMDPATLQLSTHFHTDIETNIDATRVRKLPVDITNW